MRCVCIVVLKLITSKSILNEIFLRTSIPKDLLGKKVTKKFFIDIWESKLAQKLKKDAILTPSKNFTKPMLKLFVTY